ncbi:hypothetical protein L9F63_006771, partial [Diploptera punctata]
LCGLAILVAGAISYANIDEINHALKDVNIQGSPIALIVVGSIVFIIAFYGCCGAIRESHCMIITFAIFLIVILIIEIAIGVVAFVNRDGYDEVITKNVEEMFGNYTKNDEYKTQVDSIQKSLECCGVNGPDYWTSSTFPTSCCVKPEGNCIYSKDPNVVFQAGCKAKLKEFLLNIGVFLGALAIAVGVIEIIGVVFALCLASSIKNKERR